jgi:hypothetical protein
MEKTVEICLYYWLSVDFQPWQIGAMYRTATRTGQNVRLTLLKGLITRVYSRALFRYRQTLEKD